MATKNEIIDVLRILYTAYDKQPDKDIAEVYINTLNDLPAFALEQAAYQHIKTNKWFPKVGELRELALRVPNEVEIKARENYRMSLDATYIPMGEEEFEECLIDGLVQDFGNTREYWKQVIDEKNNYCAEMEQE